jgi:hypothetical protein
MGVSSPIVAGLPPAPPRDHGVPHLRSSHAVIGASGPRHMFAPPWALPVVWSGAGHGVCSGLRCSKGRWTRGDWPAGQENKLQNATPFLHDSDNSADCTEHRYMHACCPEPASQKGSDTRVSRDLDFPQNFPLELQRRASTWARTVISIALPTWNSRWGTAPPRASATAGHPCRQRP